MEVAYPVKIQHQRDQDFLSVSYCVHVKNDRLTPMTDYLSTAQLKPCYKSDSNRIQFKRSIFRDAL